MIHQADHGSNYFVVVYTYLIEELGAKPSTRAIDDSFDNALAEAVNGLHKTELIRPRGLRRTVEQVELATLEMGVWWNNTRPHGALGTGSGFFWACAIRTTELAVRKD